MTNTVLSALIRRRMLRRCTTVPAVVVGAAAMTAMAPIWTPAALVADRLAGREGAPTARFGAALLGWTWLEAVGAGAATALWATGRADDTEAQYRLQRWWAGRLFDGLRLLGGVDIEVDGLEVLAPGPVVIVSRHVSVADAIVPAWLLGQVGMRPRYVLKDELRLDPCLDIVGGRVPNHFVDRTPDDRDAELIELEALAEGMGPLDGAVIFPEGTTMSPQRRERAIARVRERNPERADQVGGLTELGPVRPAGTAALLRGCPEADLVVITHTGFEHLHDLSQAPRALPFDAPLRVSVSRIARSAIPEGPGFVAWFDAVWADVDRRLAR